VERCVTSTKAVAKITDQIARLSERPHGKSSEKPLGKTPGEPSDKTNTGKSALHRA